MEKWNDLYKTKRASVLLETEYPSFLSFLVKSLVESSFGKKKSLKKILIDKMSSVSTL